MTALAPAFAAVPALAWAGLVVTPLIVAVGQVLFKLAGDRIGTRGNAPWGAEGVLGTLLHTALDPFMVAALLLYALGTVLWVATLRHVPLTLAHPFMALTFVLVPLMSWATLGEVIDMRYVLGLTLILVGLGVVVAR